MDSDLRARIERLLADPSRAIAVFWVAGTVAGVAAIPLGHWTSRARTILFVIVGVSLAATSVRVAWRHRLPRWTLVIDTGLATVLLSVIASLGPVGHANLASLYLVIALFGALYFRPLVAYLMLGLAGGAYAVVLAVGPGVANAAAAWFYLFVTGVILTSAVLVLVGQLSRASREDPLTLLPNRRVWDERIEEELERARRTNAAVSVAIFDVDRFKDVNDQRGHLEGDRVLRQLADGWRILLRGGGDFIARIGGDEFGLISAGADDNGIRAVVTRLREVSSGGVTCSFGVATWDHVETAASLFRRADEAMYRAKRASR
ncbi:MAG: diguanylate cyclase domain-containing protein [Acidimicrobiales bacterium]